MKRGGNPKKTNRESEPAVAVMTVDDRVRAIAAERLELQRQLVEKKEAMRAYRLQHRCFFFQPFAWQERARAMVARKNITIVAAPNKIGKCLCFQTLVDTPSGEIAVGKLYEAGRPFRVYAWNGSRKVVASASPPFKKPGLHQCYRIIMSDGRVIEAADDHRILTDAGWRSVESLAAHLPVFLQGQAESTSESCPVVHAEGAPHLRERSSNSLDHCSADFCRHDARPRLGEGIGPALVQLSGDVRARILTWWHVGDRAGTDTGSLLRFLLHPSSWYVQPQTVGLCAAFAGRSIGTRVLSWPGVRQESPPLAIAGVLDFEPTRPPVQQNQDSGDRPPSLHPSYVDTNRIVSIRSIGRQVVYDFEVDSYHNYCAGGLVHHNTALVANIAYSWTQGYEPWRPVSPDTPAAVRVDERWYRVSSLGIAPPVKLRITGEDWKSHLGETVVPAFKEWFPAGSYETKKNNEGIEYLWRFANGSSIELMTYKQREELSEAWMGHGWIPDEPPPQWLWGGMSRGIFLTGGKVLIPTTPLKEAWMLDDLILSERKDVGVIDDLLITANESLTAEETERLTGMGVERPAVAVYFDKLIWADKEHGRFVEDKGKSAERYLEALVPADRHEEISQLKLLRFVKDMVPSEAPSRLGGKFKELVGRVLKQFNRDKHWVEPFPIPTDWPGVAMIDFHLNKPHAVSYHFVNPQGVYFIVKEHWEHWTAEETADAIIRDVSTHAWRLTEVYIDPLSKGDTAYMRNRMGDELQDSFSIIANRLDLHGIELLVACKDKDSGIRNIWKHLDGVNGTPTYYVFNTCPRHLFEVQRWVYDDQGLPAKQHDDFMENWYRATLTGLVYTAPRRHAASPAGPRVAVGAQSWMGG